MYIRLKLWRGLHYDISSSPVHALEYQADWNLMNNKNKEIWNADENASAREPVKAFLWD
jgi:hypothetical protein